MCELALENGDARTVGGLGDATSIFRPTTQSSRLGLYEKSNSFAREVSLINVRRRSS